MLTPASQAESRQNIGLTGTNVIHNNEGVISLFFDSPLEETRLHKVDQYMTLNNTKISHLFWYNGNDILTDYDPTLCVSNPFGYA